MLPQVAIEHTAARFRFRFFDQFVLQGCRRMYARGRKSRGHFARNLSKKLC
jgi:hypothetical protein